MVTVHQVELHSKFRNLDQSTDGGLTRIKVIRNLVFLLMRMTGYTLSVIHVEKMVILHGYGTLNKTWVAHHQQRDMG